MGERVKYRVRLDGYVDERLWSDGWRVGLWRKWETRWFTLFVTRYTKLKEGRDG